MTVYTILFTPSRSQKHDVQFDMDVTFLLAFPNLFAAFVYAGVQLLGWKPNLSTATAWLRELKAGFLLFLNEKSLTDIHVGDISPVLVGAFIAWLNQNHPRGLGARWREPSRRKRFRSLLVILEKLRQSSEWKSAVDLAVNLRAVPWQGADKKKDAGIGSPAKNAKRELSIEHMTSIRLAAMKAVIRIMKEFDTARELIASVRDTLKPLASFKKGDVQKMTHAELLAYLDVYFASGKFSDEARPTQVITKMTDNRLKLVDFRPLFHPTAKSLVPFILLMTLAFFYNPTTIRDAKLEDFEYDEMLNLVIRFLNTDEDEDDKDTEVLTARAMKSRSHRRQPVSVPVDDAPDNPAVLLEFVKRWTAGIRKFAPPHWREVLFLFVAVVKGTAVKAFHGTTLHSEAYTWHYNLDEFCKDLGVEKFTLDELRFTLMNMALRDFGLMTARIQGNHKNIDTTESYGSADLRKQRDENLGHVMQMRTRHRENGDALDPRGHSAEISGECATPGWVCLDINDSPYTAKGKYCAAYGYCPACPLGTVDLTSPLSFALCISLLDAVNRAQQTMRPDEWLQRLGPVQEKLLKKWLPSFGPEILEQARSFNIPEMPTPE